MHLNSYTFHISLYDLASLGTIFIGLTFALQLWFTKSINRTANRFLALALGVMVLRMTWILAIDIRLETYLPGWDQLPMQFLLALGPLIYFYVLKITRPEYKLKRKDLLHFSPVLLEQAALALEIRESTVTGAATYATSAFQQLNPVLQLFIFISIITYLYHSHKLINNFYRQLQPVLMDRSRLEFRWLRRLLAATALLWLVWIAYAVVDYFGYGSQSEIHVYYPFYIFLGVIIIWTAAAAFLRPQAGMLLQSSPSPKPLPPAELRAKGAWLKKAMASNQYYQDPELNLSSLAEKLSIHPHELSRIINIALKKNFNDFINEYRIRDVASKMQDPAYTRITLLGMAYDAGFNSKATFIRAFKQSTGKSPAEYKRELEKEVSTYHLQPHSQARQIILVPEGPAWSHEQLNYNYMFRNYLRIAWRNIIRHKRYSIINVMGLALGICGCLIIYLVASFEFSFDTFHPDKERIYCIDGSIAGSPDPLNDHWNCVPAPMPDAMRNEMTGLETVAAFQHYNPKTTIKQGNKTIKKFDGTNAIITQPDYFDILQYTWLSGDKRTSLNKPMSVVLTQNRAKTYFGDLSPAEMIGRTRAYDDSLTVTVTGILKDWNKNSDFDFS